MARYDTGAIFDAGILYDATVGTLTADEAVVAGESSALPDRRVPWRDASATIWGFDPVTWLPTDQLEHVAIDATRSATLNETERQTETLTFTVAAPLTVSLDEGDWLCVQWSVTTPTDSTAFLGGVFRIVDAPGMDAADDGILYRVQAVDWFSYSTLLEVSASGWIIADEFGGLISEFTRESELIAWVSHYALDAAPGAPVAAEPWPSGVDYSGIDETIFSQVTTPGTPCRFANVLAWFWPRTSGYRLSYTSNGGVLLSGLTPTDSGLYLTTDTLVLGSVPLPAETLQHTFSRPAYTTVEYRQFNEFGTAVLFATAAAAAAEHDLNQASVERIIDTGHFPITLGAFGAIDYVRWRLQGYLGAADTLTITVDSAYPPPPLGRLVAVRILPPSGSTHQVAGWYRLVSFTQPLGNGQATWQLAWWSAFS